MSYTGMNAKELLHKDVFCNHLGNGHVLRGC